MSVGKILDRKGRAVVTMGPDSTLNQAIKLLAEHKIGAVVIIANGGIVAGILSERDIVRALAADQVSALSSPVSAHMTARVVTCAAATRINEVMELMTAGKFRHMPVLKDGRLDGMISIGDVVKSRLAELEQESQVLREYIQT